MKYSSHVQLQYLKTKYQIKESDLRAEMDYYYSQPHWQCNTTPKGRVTSVVLVAKKPQPKRKSKPVITVKKRRRIVKN